MRLAACLGVALDVIEPCGFLWDIQRIRRVGLDYVDLAETTRHRSWTAFLADRPPGRLLLLTTAAAQSYIDFDFEPDDQLLFGRESAGVPAEVHAMAQARLKVPLRAAARSLTGHDRGTGGGRSAPADPWVSGR